MKKFLALLISVAMVVALFAIPAAAEGEVTFAASVVNDANPGDDVTISVTMSGDTPYEAHGLNFGLFYDPNSLEVTGGTFHGITPGTVLNGLPFGTTVEADTTTVPGKVALGIMCPSTAFTGFGELFSVTFHVKDGVTVNQVLTVDVAQFIYSPVGEPRVDLPFIAENGAINIAGGVDPTEVPPTEVPPTEPPVINDLNDALNVTGGHINFVNESTYPWIVVNESGRAYGKSGNGGVASSSSTITATVTASAGDIVQFDYKAWGEGSDTYDWDKCQFSIDGNMVMDYGAHQNDWDTFATELTAGSHTLTWNYKKDGSVNPDGDYFAVDNVYVGAPAAVESITCTTALTVPVARTAQIEWTVLPESAYNKNVTFTSDDTSIATVSNNGVVRGIAEGETFVTITSVDNPSVYAVCEITVVDTGLVAVDLYGFCVYDFGGMYDNQVVHFIDSDPGTILDAHSANGAYAAAFAGGNVYGFENGSFFVMNAETYSISYPGTSYADGIYGMAYDHAGGHMYGITGADNRELCTIDLATGNVTVIGAITGMSNSPLSMAISFSGNAYVIEYSSGDLYSLNLSTAAATRIGATGVSNAYVQSITYDDANNQIIWAQILDASNCALYAIDPNTAAATNLGIPGSGMEICGLYIKNNLPVEVVTPDITVTFVDGLDNSTIGTMTVPAGSVLNEADFPTPPVHEGYEFTGWSYNGAAVWNDTTIIARYRDPNATTATIILNVPSDHWGDGSGYQMLLDADATAYGTIIPTSGPLTSSGNAPAGVYDEFEYTIPEGADGNCNTTNMVCANSVAIEIPAGVYDYVITNPTPGDRIWIATDNGTALGRADDYEFVAGNTYTFTVTLDSATGNDRVDLEIGGDTPPVTPPPTDVPPTTGPVAGIIWDFETDPEAQGWDFQDQDGDGFNWEWYYGADPSTFHFHEGIGYMRSASYDNDTWTALTPDNWAITPNFVVPANGEISFWAQGQDPSYAAEVLGVYIKTVSKRGTWQQVGSDVTINANDTQYTFDISAYAGQEVNVAIRHYHITDMFFANLDYVTVAGEGDIPPVTPPPTEPPTGDAIFMVESVDNVEPGSQVTVQYTLTGEYAAHVMNTVLDYDTDVLTLVNVTPGSVLNYGFGSVPSLDYETYPGRIFVGQIMPEDPMTPDTNDGVILTMTFDVADTFNAPTTIEVTVNQFGYLGVDDYFETPIPFTAIDGVISPATEPVTPEPVTPEPTDVPVTPEPTEPNEFYAYFTMGSAYDVEPGSEITLDFTVEGKYEAHILNAYLDYDTDVLTFVSAEAGAMLDGQTVVIDGETIPGSIRIAVICGEEAISAEDVLVSVTFKVADEVEVEQTVIEVIINEFGYMAVGEEDATPIDYESEDGVVTFKQAVEPTEPVEPTDAPVEPTDAPVEPTDAPVEPTDEPVTPPHTGSGSVVALGIIAIAAGAGVVLFRRKKED